MTKIGYIRVSTEEQNLDRQEDILGPITETIFKDKASGKDTKRPEFKKMMAFLRKGDILHVESISRLARSTRDLLQIVDELKEKGVGLVSLKENIDTDTPQGRFVLQVFAALSELERESIRERQREGIEAAKRRGKHLGRPKMAYPDNWDKVIKEWKEGGITAVQARKKLGLAHATFYKMVKRQQG